MSMALPLAAILVTAFAYAIGVLRIRHRRWTGGVASNSRILSMVGGLLVLLTALASPLDELAEHLLSAHMVQHLLLMMVAAPLLVCARPLAALTWVLPGAVQTAAARALASLLPPGFRCALKHPVSAGALFCSTLGFWHLPAIYRWTSGSGTRHAVMNVTFLGAALVFWSVVLDPGERRTVDRARRILLVLSTALITALPGAVMTFARRTIYHDDPAAEMPFGLTPLQDQQLAGLLMWIPMDLVLFGVAAALVWAWLSVAEQTATANCRTWQS